MSLLLPFFCVFSSSLYCDPTLGRGLMTPSGSVGKFMSCRLSHRLGLISLSYHQYGILPYAFQRKSIGFPSSCSVPLSFLRVSNAASVCPSCLQVGWPFLSTVHCAENLSQGFIPRPLSSLAYKGCGHSIILYRTFCWHLFACPESAALRILPSQFHEPLLHPDTGQLQAYTFVESLEQRGVR